MHQSSTSTCSGPKLPFVIVNRDTRALTTQPSVVAARRRRAEVRPPRRRRRIAEDVVVRVRHVDVAVRFEVRVEDHPQEPAIPVAVHPGAKVEDVLGRLGEGWRDQDPAALLRNEDAPVRRKPDDGRMVDRRLDDAVREARDGRGGRPDLAPRLALAQEALSGVRARPAGVDRGAECGHEQEQRECCGKPSAHERTSLRRSHDPGRRLSQLRAAAARPPTEPSMLPAACGRRRR